MIFAPKVAHPTANDGSALAYCIIVLFLLMPTAHQSPSPQTAPPHTHTSTRYPAPPPRTHAHNFLHQRKAPSCCQRWQFTTAARGLLVPSPKHSSVATAASVWGLKSAVLRALIQTVSQFFSWKPVCISALSTADFNPQTLAAVATGRRRLLALKYARISWVVFQSAMWALGLKERGGKKEDLGTLAMAAWLPYFSRHSVNRINRIRIPKEKAAGTKRTHAYTPQEAPCKFSPKSHPPTCLALPSHGLSPYTCQPTTSDLLSSVHLSNQLTPLVTIALTFRGATCSCRKGRNQPG